MTQSKSGANIIGAIGNTPLVELVRVVPEGCARAVVKVEASNPTGNMKDRMAVSVIDGALARDQLGPSGSVVEYTGGSIIRTEPRHGSV